MNFRLFYTFMVRILCACLCLPADVGPCDVNICQNGGRCTRVSDTQRCDCREGYVGDRCETGKDQLYISLVLKVWTVLA